MAMSAAERKNAKYHCGPGDSYPINSEADAHDAWNLAGHADNPESVRACVRRVAKKEGWSLPKTASVQASLDAITFEDDDWVTRSGKVFAVGKYDSDDPAQQFELTEAEADAAVAAFTPVQNELEHLQTNHRPTIFDGRLGQLERVWREGADLHGQVKVPKWVDTVWSEAGRKVSLVFDPLTKQIIRNGLVLRPRVQDAVMMAQASVIEANGPPTSSEQSLAAAYAEFAGKRHSSQDLADMQAVHDITVRQGALCATGYGIGGAPLLMGQQETNMAETKEKGTGGQGEGAAQVQNPPPALPVEFTQLQSEHQRLLGELAVLRAERRLEKARVTVREFINKGKLLPAQFAQAVANLAQDYADDEATPVQFAAEDGKPKLSRAENRLAEWGANPTLQLTEDRIPVTVIGFAEGERKAEDNFLTPEGAAAAAKKFAQARNGAK